MSDVTRILNAITDGDPHAANELLPLVYDELRYLAAQKLAREAPGQTLEATALVHEAYLRLVDVDQAQDWNSRGHFFAAAAEAMRRILIDQARHKHGQRRGGGRKRQPLERVEVAAPEPSLDVLAVHDALERFEQVDPVKAQALDTLMDDAVALTKDDAMPGAGCCDAADVCALASAAATEAGQRESYANQALALLRRAQTAGFFKDRLKIELLKKDADLDSLRSREDFKKFVAELEPAAKP